MLSALFDVSVWECVNAVTKGLFLTLDHPLANDYDCFASVVLLELARGGSHVRSISALVSANIMPGISHTDHL